MEIERKFLPDLTNLPFDPADYPVREIEQGYLCTAPVVRVRKDNDSYILTYKSKGLMVREEYNLPLTEEGYRHLIAKADGRVIRKKRYVIPLKDHLTLELDIFEGDLKPLVIAEIEFPDEDTAVNYQPPAWLGEDVTCSPLYHNSVLSRMEPSDK
jgi:CYTH domain-containing protein